MHLVDGPLKENWTIETSIAHSILKGLFTLHPPQGRHSMGIIKFFSRLQAPKFLFSANIEEAEIIISRTEKLHEAVCSSLGVDRTKLKSTNTERGKRKIQGEWIVNGVDDKTDKVVLYFHGGAHYFLTPSAVRGITTRIAKLSNARVFAVDYRLAPDHPFPFAIEDALGAYLAVTNLTQSIEHCEVKFSDTKHCVVPSKVFIMGDSSGACLTMQLLQAIRGLDLPMPSGAVLLSPFLDHELLSNSWLTNFHSDFLSLDLVGIKWSMDVYSNGIPLSHPALSPVKTNLELLPPILIQAGDSEVVTDDAIRLFAQKAYGNNIELQLYKNMFHVFHAFSFIKQSQYAIERIGKFMSSCLDDNDSDSLKSENTVFESGIVSINHRNAIEICKSK